MARKTKVDTVKKRPGPRTEEVIAKALFDSVGNVTQAAIMLGMDRSAVNKRIAESPRLKEVLADARATFVDTAESALLKKIMQGDTIAIIFALKTQGKDRGYVERQETTGADGQPVTYRLILDGQDDQ